MARLSNAFASGSPSIRSRDPLTDEQIMRVAPSIFAEAPHESRSDRYTYIPTSVILNGLRNEGFQPFMVGQSRSRIPGKAEFTKHMIRMRHASEINDTEANEIILLNSHDGTSSYQMMAGMFRFVCMNGLVLGDTYGDVRVRHKGNVEDDVIEGAYTVLESTKRAKNARDEMRGIALDAREQQAFANSALLLRYETPDASPIQPQQILRPRRWEDDKHDLWSVFNKVQENMLKGGLRGYNANNRRTTTREVTGIDQSTKLNRALWTLAEQMHEIKTGTKLAA